MKIVVLDIPILNNGYALAQCRCFPSEYHYDNCTSQKVLELVSRGDLILSGTRTNVTDPMDRYEIRDIYEVRYIFDVVRAKESDGKANVVELFDNNNSYVKRIRYPYGFMPESQQVTSISFGHTFSTEDIVLDLVRRNPFSINWPEVTKLIGTEIEMGINSVYELVL